MAFSKSNIFTEEDYRNAVTCKALGHPARIFILKYLHAEQNCIPQEILKHLPLSKPTISHHLKILREAQILDFEEKYPNIIYRISDDLSNFQKQTLKNLFSVV